MTAVDPLVAPSAMHAGPAALTDRVAIVTGAAGLLGREHAAALRLAGAHVVLVDTDAARARDAESALPDAPGHTLCAGADVTEPADLTAVRDMVLAHFGRVDVLVNNAAIDDKVEGRAGNVRDPDLLDYPLEAFRRMLDVNVTGVFNAARVFGAPMLAAGGGSIINIASTYGLVAPDPALYRRRDGRGDFLKSPAYPTSKAAVLGLTRYLAAAWGGRGVRVNALAPGGVSNGQDDWFVENYERRTPLGRMAQPGDYRGAIVFLASDASRYMTGATLVVDGGFTAW